MENKQIAGISPAAEALLQRMHFNWSVVGNNDYVIPAVSDENVIVQELVNRSWVYLAASGYGGTEHTYRLTTQGTMVAADSLNSGKSAKSALSAKLEEKIAKPIEKQMLSDDQERFMTDLYYAKTMTIRDDDPRLIVADSLVRIEHQHYIAIFPIANNTRFVCSLTQEGIDYVENGGSPQ